MKLRDIEIIVIGGEPVKGIGDVRLLEKISIAVRFASSPTG